MATLLLHRKDCCNNNNNIKSPAIRSTCLINSHGDRGWLLTSHRGEHVHDNTMEGSNRPFHGTPYVMVQVI